MNLDERVTQAVHRVAAGVVPPQVDLDVVRGRARANRRRTVAVAVVVVAAAAAVVVAGGALVAGPDRGDPAPVEPVPSPRVVGSGPVWYDDTGLHHGDVVEQTPFDLFVGGEGGGALALVRGGAVYLEPLTGDVWFHPWQGEPRVIGHDSYEGPGTDPHGDVAVWFEGNVMVAYDTARGREILRTPPEHSDDATVPYDTLREPWTEHVAAGNGFMHVSAREVVWRSEFGVHRLDLATGAAGTLWKGQPGDGPRFLEDVSSGRLLWGDNRGGLTIESPGTGERPLDDVEPVGRFSADGSHVVAPWLRGDTHGAGIADVRTGETWLLDEPTFYAWIAWSYGDTALVHADRDGETQLLACDAVTHECDRLPTTGDVLLPTS